MEVEETHHDLVIFMYVRYSSHHDTFAVSKIDLLDTFNRLDASENAVRSEDYTTGIATQSRWDLQKSCILLQNQPEIASACSPPLTAPSPSPPPPLVLHPLGHLHRPINIAIIATHTNKAYVLLPPTSDAIAIHTILWGGTSTPTIKTSGGISNFRSALSLACLLARSNDASSPKIITFIAGPTTFSEQDVDDVVTRLYTAATTTSPPRPPPLSLMMLASSSYELDSVATDNFNKLIHAVGSGSSIVWCQDLSSVPPRGVDTHNVEVWQLVVDGGLPQYIVGCGNTIDGNRSGGGEQQQGRTSTYNRSHKHQQQFSLLKNVRSVSYSCRESSLDTLLHSSTSGMLRRRLPTYSTIASSLSKNVPAGKMRRSTNKDPPPKSTISTTQTEGRNKQGWTTLCCLPSTFHHIYHQDGHGRVVVSAKMPPISPPSSSSLSQYDKKKKGVFTMYQDPDTFEVWMEWIYDSIGHPSTSAEGENDIKEEENERENVFDLFQRQKRTNDANRTTNPFDYFYLMVSLLATSHQTFGERLATTNNGDNNDDNDNNNTWCVPVRRRMQSDDMVRVYDVDGGDRIITIVSSSLLNFQRCCRDDVFSTVLYIPRGGGTDDSTTTIWGDEGIENESQRTKGETIQLTTDAPPSPWSIVLSWMVFLVAIVVAAVHTLMVGIQGQHHDEPVQIQIEKRRQPTTTTANKGNLKNTPMTTESFFAQSHQDVEARLRSFWFIKPQLITHHATATASTSAASSSTTTTTAATTISVKNSMKMKMENRKMLLLLKKQQQQQRR